jgi:oligoendopeptidase F
MCPLVFLSWKGKRQDLFTLAHELGHAVHSMLAAPQGIFQFQATLPLAETASIFGEMLLANRLLANATDKELQTDILFHMINNAYATVGRQAFFALFENEAHDLVGHGATPADISKAYYQNLSEQFGDFIELSDEFHWEWVSIPHFFHTPFYVYAYSFGQLLVYSLWRLFEKEGQAFVPKFLQILSRGGGALPQDILAEAGVGPLDEAFWEGGFAVIESFIDKL